MLTSSKICSLKFRKRYYYLKIIKIYQYQISFVSSIIEWIIFDGLYFLCFSRFFSDHCKAVTIVLIFRDRYSNTYDRWFSLLSTYIKMEFIWIKNNKIFILTFLKYFKFGISMKWNLFSILFLQLSLYFIFIF